MLRMGDGCRVVDGVASALGRDVLRSAAADVEASGLRDMCWRCPRWVVEEVML